MKRAIFMILVGSLVTFNLVAQTTVPAANNSISIQYDLSPGSKNTFISATASSNHDLLNGMSYNHGDALKFNISSSAPYFISMSSFSSSYSPGSSAIPLNAADISNYIFYKVVDNNTGGQSIASNNPEGNVLGKTERVIIANCPATRTAGVNNTPVTRNFGLLFKVHPGYSLPPGNYTTQIMITATYE